MSDIKKILVVCTGNACRSPMAEGFLKEHLKPEEGFEIISAGTSAMDGILPTPDAVDVMKEEGVNISNYRSSFFNKEFAQAADLILVMAGIHKKTILREFPSLEDKVYLYNEFAGINNGASIADPIGQPAAVYERVRDEIKEATLAIVAKVKSGDTL